MCFFYPPAYWYACLVLPHFLTSFIRQCTKRTFPNLLRTHKWFVGGFPLQMGILKGVCMVGALHFPTFFVRKSTKSAVSNLIYAMRTPKFVFFPHMGRLTEVCFAWFPDFLGVRNCTKSLFEHVYTTHTPQVFFSPQLVHMACFIAILLFLWENSPKNTSLKLVQNMRTPIFPPHIDMYVSFDSISCQFPEAFQTCLHHAHPLTFFSPLSGVPKVCLVSCQVVLSTCTGFFFLKSFLFCCYFTAFQSTLTLTLWPKHLQYAPWHFWYCTPQPNLTTIRVITFAQFSRKKNSPKGTPAWRHNPVLFWEARWGRTPVNGAACPNLSRSQFCARSCSPRSWCQRKQK